MRMLELRLEKYGPFECRSLHFRPDARLHLVYGPNEAGKSSALAALTDLLFGIEQQTRFAFRHAMPQLRLGGLVEAADGKSLNFQRRKGSKNTLLDPSDTPIPDHSLSPFLGNVTRDMFCRVFGLTTDTLRAGAVAMLRANGEIGQTLFDVASGLHSMLELRTSLEKEADSIFAPRASKDRRFYQILDRYETARKQVRDLALKADDWQERNDQIAVFASRLAEVEQKLKNNRMREGHLSRLRRTAPLMCLIERDLSEIERLGELPDMPGEFTERLRAALNRRDDARREHDQTATERKRLEAELSGIVVDAAMLAADSQIQKLFAQTGAYRKAQIDLPRVLREAEDCGQELNQIARRLGLRDAEDVERRLPNDMAIAALDELIERGRKLADRQKQCRENLADEVEMRENLRAQSNGSLTVNPRLLREKFERLSPILKKLDRRAQTALESAEEQNALIEEAARLNPSVVSLAALAQKSLPSRETIERFRREQDRLRRASRETEKEVERLESETSKIQRRFQSYQTSKHVPSREEVQVQRGQRDQAWSELKAMLLGQSASVAEEELAGTVSGYERQVAESDRLADSAFEKAELVAKLSRDAADLDELQVQLDLERQRAAEATANLGQHQDEWEGLWQPAGVAPLPPSEMADWLTRVEALFARLRKNNRMQAGLTELNNEISASLPALRSLAAEAGAEKTEESGAERLAAAIEARLHNLEKSWDDANRVQTGIQDAESRIDKLRRNASEIAADLDKWRKEWSVRTVEIGLTGHATTGEAEAALAAWSKVPDILRERKERLRRVAGMNRDSREFEECIHSLIEEAAADLTDAQPAAEVVEKLNQRRGVAAEAQARRDQVAKRLAEASKAAEAAAGKLQEAERDLEALTLPVPSGTDLGRLVEHLTIRSALTNSLEEHRRQMIEQGDGFDEDQLRRDLEGFDADSARAELGRVERERVELENDRTETSVKQKLASKELEELSLGIGGELANQELKNAEAELAEAAHDWAVLKLGEMLIANAIEKKRKEQKDPLIRRAGEMFSIITGGAFSEIAPAFGEDDQPIIEGRRKSGELLDIPSLSEGTRDQLYLALRLAYIEEFANQSEPIPFVGDDLFTSFDDQRTAHGIEAMAAIGARVQPILFTHHARVVEIGRDRLGDAIDVIALS